MSQEEIVGQSAQAELVHQDFTAVRICVICEGTYSSERAYKRHFNTKVHRLAIGEPLAPTITCNECDRTFTRDSDLKRHETQGRCPSRLAAPNPPSTVLGKRAFDEKTQLPEGVGVKVMSDSRPIVARYVLASAWHHTDTSYTAADQAWRVAAQEHATLASRERSVFPNEIPRSLIGKDVTTDLTSTLQEDALPTLAATASLPTVVSQELFEPFTETPLYVAEDTSLPSMVNDFEWVDDPTGHYDLVELHSLQDLNGVGSLEREVGESVSQLATILESPAVDAGPENTAGTTMIDTNSKQEPPVSSKTRLQHILVGPVVLPLKTIRGRQPLSLRGQKCSFCKKPYERNGVALRQHLDSHLSELQAQQAHFCGECQVGFVHQRDLHHHTNIANSGSCCGLAPNHTGPCKGYLCGFNFKHTAPCNGHHPPRDSSVAWSDHDRFKFGYFLRNWEVAQLQVAVAEASQVQRLQEVARCISTFSISECGSGKQKSVTSWRSEPIRMNAGAKDPQLQFMDLNRSRAPSKLSRLQQILLSLPHGRSSKEEEHLLYAAATGDDDTIISCARQGARLDGALALAAGQGHVEVVKTLLKLGAPLETDTLYDTIVAVISKA
ncbi:hypothetical protein LTR56_023847 [Elasticomyces elasticus]|nr:hypothetical protein LTR56_023847 [Elasticomyces elasticus]KAK3666845.1 hypothetical protein LTR22_002432 [Elasticomyces elasticus]KAK4907768.1 hypothetical protein LTR49_023232 [Elasticomyces elasticus]KAK5746979.1 hypothetical protein LTS12_022548 [Elasticomyces elasticus]